MCLRTTPIRPYQKWAWEGHQIVQEPLIPRARTLPRRGRSGASRKPFDIDARQFLAIQGDAVIQREMAAVFKRLKTDEDRAYFSSRKRGSFDFRARKVLEYLEGRLKYFPSGKGFDPWLFPGETFAAGGGDCEDLSFALYGLLRASGISDYCLRVVFGLVKQENPALGKKSTHHAWVVYKDEVGAWRILEPLAISEPKSGAKRNSGRNGSKELLDIEYIPQFVLNPQHLWNVRGPEKGPAMRFPDYIEHRKFWNGFDPGFAYKIHEEIFDLALPQIPDAAMKAIKSLSYWIDVEVHKYDPRDHFDFAYVDAGWARIKARKATGRIDDLAYALHAVGDFYSHTLYAKFAAPRPDGTIPPYDENSFDSTGLAYDFTGFKLPHCDHGTNNAAAHWRGELISGQWWRWFTTFPDELQDAPGFDRRFCLPDHDRVAVDGPKHDPDHYYFPVKADHEDQFRKRHAVAVEHIRKFYREWEAQHGPPVVPKGILGPLPKGR